MKSVAYLLEYPLDLPGGAQMSTHSICMGLFEDENREFEPIVICPELLKKSVDDYPYRVVTYRMGDNRIKNLIVRIFAFRKILKEIKPDIVHIQMPESLITYGMAFPLRSPSKLFFTDRGMYFGYRRHSLMLMKWVLKKAEVLLVTTDVNKELWTENTRIRPIKKISNSISDVFSEYDDRKRHKGDFVIGFAGRVCEEKNWPLVSTILEKCAAKGIKVKTHIVMSTFEPGDELVVESVKDGAIKALGRENVRVSLDLTQDEMAEYYYGIDVFVMTSSFESFGKAAVEAMSRKCAVIATDVGGLKEVVGREDNLYTEKTVDKCVDFINKMKNDDNALENERNYFYNRYLSEFSPEKCIEKHKALYKGEV